MAGLPLSLALTPAPIPPSLGASDIAPTTTRTRRCLGAFQLGAVMAGVFASRRRADDRGVSVALGQEHGAITAHMTPAQARQLARALVEAAAAADAAQRQVQFTRAEVCHG